MGTSSGDGQSLIDSTFSACSTKRRRTVAMRSVPITIFADGTSPNDTRTLQLAAFYDFVAVRLFANLGGKQNSDTAPLHISCRLWELSAAVPIGSGRLLSGFGSRRTGDTVLAVPVKAAGGNLARKGLTVGYGHLLSKRTDAYSDAGARPDTHPDAGRTGPGVGCANSTTHRIGPAPLLLSRVHEYHCRAACDRDDRSWRHSHRLNALWRPRAATMRFNLVFSSSSIFSRLRSVTPKSPIFFFQV